MKYLTSIMLLLLLMSCEKKEDDNLPPPPPADEIVEYLHIAHTRSGVEGEIPEMVTAVDYEKYPLLCLGGDIDVNTSSLESTLAAWNEVFHFDDTTTLWALGNHDVANRPLIEEYTHRSSFYTYHTQNISFIVLDTELNFSMIENEQLELVQNVCDSISESTALIILTHKLLWLPGNDELEPSINDIANGAAGNCLSCTQPNNFYDDIYPQLVEVKNRGIEVLCIAGDIGFNVKEFEYLTDEGIHFIGSGIQYTHEGNKGLILENNLTDQSISWRFELLENL